MAKNSSLPSNASQSYGIKSEGGRSNEVGFDKYKERGDDYSGSPDGHGSDIYQVPSSGRQNTLVNKLDNPGDGYSSSGQKATKGTAAPAKNSRY